MIAAVSSIALLGLSLGYVLGMAARYLKVEGNPLAEELEALLPNTNCGQCGYPGCNAAADALSKGEASVALCPPGGKALVEELANKLGVEADLDGVEEKAPLIAQIQADLCTGCTKCYRVCPTDAIIGANKQIHAVISDACIGCEKCLEKCPDDCITMEPIPDTLQTWRWDKPARAA